MTNKNLSNIIIISVSLAIFAGLFEEELGIGISDIFYTLAGFGMAIFGIWAAIRLRKLNE